MGILNAVLLALAGLVAAALAKLLADEYKAWAPTINSSILAIAARLVPAQLRDRFSEESNSDLNELPGDLSRLVFSLGCLIAAVKISHPPLAAGRSALGYLAAVFAAFFFAPLLIGSTIALMIGGRGILKREPRIGRNGKKIILYKFKTDVETTVGKFLYLTYFNELAVLLNVLRCDLNLFGPPALKEHETSLLLTERPGLVRDFKSLLKLLDLPLRN